MASADGIESQNVVGYQEYELVKGYNLYSPVFEAVSGTMNLQDLKLQNVVTGSGANKICLLDSNGLVKGTYEWWLPEDGTGEEKGCWFNGDDWAAIEDVTVNPGEGLYLYTVDDGLSILSAGSVRLSDYSVDLAKGYTLVGNASPADLAIQDFKLQNVITGSGANKICLLDSKGLVKDTYEWWLPDDGTGEDAGCWFNGDDWEMIEGVTIQAGEGLYVYTVDEGIKFTYPKAIQK